MTSFASITEIPVRPSEPLFESSRQAVPADRSRREQTGTEILADYPSNSGEPFDLSTNLHLGWHYLHARNYDAAIEQLKKVIELEPKFFLAHLILGMAYEQQGNFPGALEEFKEASLSENSPVVLGFLGYTYAALEDRSKAMEILDELRERSKHSYVPAYSMALIHSRLGEQDEAFEHLDKAFMERNQWLISLNVAPEFDSLRLDPRFETLVRRANLDQ